MVIGDFAFLGGLAAVHQFCRIGQHAFVGGLSGVERDVIPYGMAVGDRARLVGLNLRGLQRRDFAKENIQALRSAYRMMFAPEGTLAERVDDVAKHFGQFGPVEEVVKGTFGKNQALFNNAGQHYNHLHFWNWMKPNGGGAIPGKLEKAIVDGCGSIDKFKEDFIQAGMTQFGSGWAWLAVKDGKLQVMKTPNGENPLVHGGTPVLGCDVWEHSYYIDYRNRRADYLKAFVDSLVNWDYVLEMYEKAAV